MTSSQEMERTYLGPTRDNNVSVLGGSISRSHSQHHTHYHTYINTNETFYMNSEKTPLFNKN